jgi:hypothetical protein
MPRMPQANAAIKPIRAKEADTTATLKAKQLKQMPKPMRSMPLANASIFGLILRFFIELIRGRPRFLKVDK